AAHPLKPPAPSIPTATRRLCSSPLASSSRAAAHWCPTTPPSAASPPDRRACPYPACRPSPYRPCHPSAVCPVSDSRRALHLRSAWVGWPAPSSLEASASGPQQALPSTEGPKAQSQNTWDTLGRVSQTCASGVHRAQFCAAFVRIGDGLSPELIEGRDDYLHVILAISVGASAGVELLALIAKLRANSPLRAGEEARTAADRIVVAARAGAFGEPSRRAGQGNMALPCAIYPWRNGLRRQNSAYARID